jgi:hypothetical protein
MNHRKPHRLYAGLTFLLTVFLMVLAAGILLPWVRGQPEFVHEHFNGLRDWLRISFVFFLSVLFTALMFKLLSPRLNHLAHCKSYPPTWLAAFVAWILVAIIDVFVGFDTDGYRATAFEWLGYGGGSFFVVVWYFRFRPEVVQYFRKPEKQQSENAATITLQDIETAPWEDIEKWLQSDAPARYDFLDNHNAADRVSELISRGTRSVGIVGPFGSGKTTLVKWVADRLAGNADADRRYFVCYHSCWGFETSASAIHDMLRSAILKLNLQIDTFQVNSLPESYRRAFSAGSNWIETISNLVLRSPDPTEQFKRLSELLGDVGGRMVFIVEDLDRNETRNFEIQEVLAFLEHLKPFPNLSFVLTGGLSSSQRIDYARLCDHIEYLRTVQPQHSSALIELLRQRCLDPSIFPHERLADPNRNYEWNPLTDMLMRDYEELPLPQAVAYLLNTPRSLRHALGRTFTAWRTLHGEIDFNHLLAVNVLRFGAPECFQFLIRRWDRLHSPPNQRSPFSQDRIDRIRQAIVDDWNGTIKNVEWNPTAALRVMRFILPATEYWLVDESQSGHSDTTQQGVSQERYWIRVVNESLDEDDASDQEVIRDIRGWLEAPDTETELVTKLTSLPQYSDVWENLAGSFFANQRDHILLLCEHVVRRILREQGSSASCDSQGFVHTCRLATRRVSHQQENQTWLRDRISEAASVSIEMVNGLWLYYGNPGQYSILQIDDGESVRQHVLDTLRANVTDGQSLIARLHPNASATLYQLVFDPGNNEDQRILADVQSWSWLGAMILDALRSRNALAAANCGVLLSDRASGRERISVDVEVLNELFGDAANEVIDILDEMVDQLPEADQTRARNIVGAARQEFEGERTPTEGDCEVDAD